MCMYVYIFKPGWWFGKLMCFFFQSVGEFDNPTDLHIYHGVGIPPERYWYICIYIYIYIHTYIIVYLYMYINHRVNGPFRNLNWR